jgi:hypothetical protein
MSKSKTAPARKKPRPTRRRPASLLEPIPIPFVKPFPVTKLVKLNDKQSLRIARAEARIGASAIVSQILWEIEAEVAARGKTLSSTAFQEFRPRLQHGVSNKLLNGGNWATDGAKVRAAGKQMGAIAVFLAEPSPTVTKAQIHPSFYSVKNGSTVCSSTSGAGSWCDFFI